jgi:lipopolysaccharide/colanic/teichoic acid biosynthesis glycosyltransferase
MYANWVKRPMDILAAIGLGLLTLPLLLILMLLVRVRLGSPVIFLQERAGAHERIFTMRKLRTMTSLTDSNGALLPDADRLTPFGSWLRSTSMDELPEIWSVLRGDMSFVGPRPLPGIYLERYDDEQRLRHSVRPGLTGLAQVSGRNALTWPERFELDVWYARNSSLRLDLTILWRTLSTVLSRQGVAEEGSATMTEFNPET